MDGKMGGARLREPFAGARWRAATASRRVYRLERSDWNGILNQGNLIHGSENSSVKKAREFITQNFLENLNFMASPPEIDSYFR